MNYTVDDDGFFGQRYNPENNKYKNKAMIVFTGSDGEFSFACKMAQYFNSIGITSIALAYFREEGLPETLVRVPVEYIKNAVNYLKNDGFDKIGVCGISKGGELALLSASLLNSISGVIAVSPMHVVCGGFNGLKEANKSSWTYKGEDIPYTNEHLRMSEVIKRSLKNREVTMNFAYEDAVSKMNPESIIKVENINGPVLLVSADYDSMWPSKFACEKVIERLKKYNFKYEYKHLNYEYASHIIFPINTVFRFYFKVERKYKKECAESREDLSSNIQEWIKNW